MVKNIGFKFVIQSIIGFGFLGGIFTRIGFKPEKILIDFFSVIIKNLVVFDLIPNYDFSPFFAVIGPIMAVTSIYTAYKIGGLLGFIGVIFAFLGGFFIGQQVSMILMGVALFLGLVAPYYRK